jgi:hypothetical protein
MAIYVLYVTRELGLSAASVGLIFGLGGGVGVLVGSAAAASVARLFGLGRTLVLAHLLFGVFGMFLAFTVGVAHTCRAPGVCERVRAALGKHGLHGQPLER